MKDLTLSIREIDDLLQHLYLKLKGKKEGLSLAEPAAILLSRLKASNPSFYVPQLASFTPIIMDTLISDAYLSFGYEGLESLDDVAGDIALASGEYIPEGVERGLENIRAEISAVSAILGGGGDPGVSAGPSGERGSGTGGFFRERAWGSAGLPLVSIYSTGERSFSTGRVVVARLEVRLTGEWSMRLRHDPVINFEHISAEPNSPFERQMHTAIIAAEKHCVSRMGLKSLLRTPREYRLSLPEIASFPASAIQRLSGGSAGLAVASLLVSVLSRLDIHRHRLDIDPGIAFTGTVDDSGNVLEVEDAHIADKVRAVFFSRFSRLILPSRNLETGERELSVLNGDHPSRKLALIPAARIKDVFDDTRVVSREKVPAGKSFLQRMFMRRKQLLTAASLATLALISLLIVRPYYRRDIAEVMPEGSRILITNKFGRLITEHEIGFPIPPTKKYCQNYRSYIGDFDGNGENEALCVYSDSRHLNSSSPYNRLHFIGFDNKARFRGRFIFDDEMLLGDQMNEDGRNFPIDITKFSVIFQDDQGKSRFLAILNHASRGPAAVVNLSLEDFTRHVFLHQGFLFQTVMRDIDSDGTEDIILSGYNTILGSCIVVVLDQLYMNGSSPEGADYDIAGFGDIAKYYLRLPDFDRCKPFKGNDWLPILTKVKNSLDELIVTMNGAGNDVDFHIGERMECVRAEILESYSEKKDPSRPRLANYDYDRKAQDEEMLRKGVRYWDGKRWVAEPAVNASFRAYVAGAIDNRITKIDHVGTRLVMMNSEGYEVTNYDVGFSTPGTSAYRQVLFGDYLPEEGDEILCALLNSYHLHRRDPERNKLFILIFDEKGRLLRKHVYHENSIMGTEMERPALKTSMQMLTSSAPFSEEFGDGALFIGTHHKTEPPATMIRLSLDDGSSEVFFHKGFFSSIIPRDIDGDGKKEILLTGYNTSLDAPVIIALDPGHIDGSSPGGACYSISGRNRDNAKYYVRLPFFDGYEMYPSRFQPLHLHVLENADVLRILVKSRAEDVIYTMEDNLDFTDAEIVEAFRGSSGRIDSFVTVTYPEKTDDERKLLRGIRFWNGERWVEEPAANGSYLRLAREGD